VRGGVGINEVQNFGKYRVSGTQGARGWLDRVMAGRIPQTGARGALADAVEKGRIIGDFTISCLGEASSFT
jgi:dimethylglycine dehydrogenase